MHVPVVFAAMIDLHLVADMSENEVEIASDSKLQIS